jgi:YHS domain-containing protein
MKTVSMLLTVAVLSVGGLAIQPEMMAAANAAPKKAAAKGKAGTPGMPKNAVCVICSVKEGKREPEPVKASLKYKGKMYYFCNLNEKAEFISNPSKYAAAFK